MADWTDTENDLIVETYLRMLSLELAGTTYVKREHNRQVRTTLSRSHASVEFKWQNVSAVLLGMGLPWITGYKPKANFQGSLVDAVVRATRSHSLLSFSADPKSSVASDTSAGEPLQLRQEAERYAWPHPKPAEERRLSIVDVPSVSELNRTASESRKRVAGFFDPAARDARNRSIGERGEALVLDHERAKLSDAGRPDLAERVEWSSKMVGDGLGYDISTFEVSGEPRQLEIKTTPGWATTPFHLSRNEREVAERDASSWRLVRVWDIARRPRAFVLRPPLVNQLHLTATSFEAELRRTPEVARKRAQD